MVLVQACQGVGQPPVEGVLGTGVELSGEEEGRVGGGHVAQAGVAPVVVRG